MDYSKLCFGDLEEDIKIDYFDINNGFIKPWCTYEGFINLNQIYGVISYNNIIIGEFRLNNSKIDDNYVYFYCFQIYEDFRNKGYGKKFLENLIQVLKSHILPMVRYGENQYCKGMTLDCDVDNLIAKKLYLSLGFQNVKNCDRKTKYKLTF